MALRLLHVADVHLGASCSAFGALAEERRGAVRRAFLELPAVAARHGVHAVLVAGDLFDGPRPDADAVATAREAFRSLVAAGREVLVVPGNHDSVLHHPHPYRDELGGAHVFLAPAFGDPVTLETEGGPLHCYGIAYDGASVADPLSTFRRAAAPGTHVVLVHGSVHDGRHWDPAAGTLRIATAALAALGADYVALGDHHRFRPPESFGPGVPACYCGSFAAQDLTETGRHGPVLVELEPGAAPRVAALDSGVRQVEDVGELDVATLDGATAVADAIAARTPEGTVPVVTLVGEPAFALDVEEVRRHVEKRFGLARVHDRTLFFSSARLDEIAAEDTLAGHLVRLARIRLAEAPDDDRRRIVDRALRLGLRALRIE